MEITDIRIKKFDTDNRLKAIAAITFDDCFVIHELRVIDGKEGLFVAMPSRKMPNGEFKDVAHPINQETRDYVESVVIDAYHKLLEEEAAKQEQEAASEESESETPEEEASDSGEGSEEETEEI